MEKETATFGAGCFWGVEEHFRQLRGVTDTAVGYMGGHTENPTYKDVCKGDTGHVEVVQVIFDPDVISYQDLLQNFWMCHDPTQVNRQGPDKGTQYRSVIFYHDEAQHITAEESKKSGDETGLYKGPIATEIKPVQTFYRAEEYHQRYVEKRGGGSCRI